MRYCVTVFVPGTDHLRYETDRLVGKTGPFSEAERLEAINAVATQWPLVDAILQLKNALLPPTAVNERARIEVFPLYDSADAIVDTLVHMEDSALAVVPVDAISVAPMLTDVQRAMAFERLATMAISTLPPQVQAAIPAVISGN